jgi:hypothetical protein
MQVFYQDGRVLPIQLVGIPHGSIRSFTHMIGLVIYHADFFDPLFLLVGYCSVL